MKKLLLALLAAVLSFTLCAALADGVQYEADTEEAFGAIIANMAAQEAQEFEIHCTDDLYEIMKDGYFNKVNLQCYLNGVQDFSLRYSGSARLFLFSELVYTDTPFEMLSSAREAEDRVSSWLANDAKAFGYYCPDETVSNEIRDVINALMPKYGYEDWDRRGNTSSGIYRYSEFVPFAAPYAVVSDVNDAVDAMISWRAKGVSDFSLVFPVDCYETIDRSTRRRLEFLGGVSNASIYTKDKLKVLQYKNVEWDMSPAVYCGSEDEIVSAFRAMGVQGVAAFNMMLPEDLFNALKENSFAGLGRLEAQAGMSNRSLKYSITGGMLYFSDVVIQADAHIIDNLPELLDYMAQCAGRMDETITLFMSDDLYATMLQGITSYSFSTDKNARFHDLTANIGICGYMVSRNPAAGMVTFSEIKYYPGFRIMHAVNGQPVNLTARETQARDVASNIASQCSTGDPLTTLQAIHDTLCGMIVYTDDKDTDEDDNCIGAILTGEANCDGYADALYLIGGMAGLEVRYQHGDSLKQSFGSMFSTHMWNVVKLNGTWRLVDVTWDDDDEVMYTWFNIGYDRASRSHKWNEDMTVALDPVTDMGARPEGEFIISDLSQVAQAVNSGRSIVVMMPDQNSGITLDDLFEASRQVISGSYRYSRDDNMGYLRLILH